MKSLRSTTVLAALTLIGSICKLALADPLPGEVLKFEQLPLNNGVAPSIGGAPYPGHDEWSTANSMIPGPLYQGTFMADDFADKLSRPVVHVQWWGSYQNNDNLNYNNGAGAPNFLISFESDLPSDPLLPNNASRPDQPLLTQVVTKGALSAGSGTFTEQLNNGSVLEHLYQYNAELALPFNEVKDTVYWLKIVALIDPAVDGPLNWGWHNRDWSIFDPLASTAVSPGEGVIGSVPNSAGQPVNVYHFQDDAVSGRINIVPNAGGTFSVSQSNYNPENYVWQTPGTTFDIDGPNGIQNYSKDLAFRLYTTPVPEPSTLVLLGIGALGVGLAAWRRRRTG